MASGIEIYNADGSINLSNSDLTTFVLGEKHIDKMVDAIIQDDYLIGKVFWYTILNYDDIPVGRWSKSHGLGYYIPDLSFNPSTGTAIFTWSKEYYNVIFDDNATNGASLGMVRNGYSGFTIIYGGT